MLSGTAEDIQSTEEADLYIRKGFTEEIISKLDLKELIKVLSR